MDQNKKDFGILSDLADVADKLQVLHSGRVAIIFELDRYDYDKAIRMFDRVDRKSDSFKIDISGVEFIYVLKPEE